MAKETLKDKTKIFIETASADAVVDPNQRVYVKVGTHELSGYVEKLAKDIHEGDRIVVRRNCINKTVDDILPILRKGSIRYSFAEDQLYRIKGESRVPLLRALLLEGLAKQSEEDLEAKIMQEEKDFTPEQYASFADSVYNVLKKQVPEKKLVTKQTIRDWLKGKTLAPQDWDNLTYLTEINPKLAELVDESKGKLNFRSSYDFVVQTRRVVMKRLLGMGTTENGEETKQTQKNSQKYDLETGIVVDQVIDPVDSTTTASRVTKVEPWRGSRTDSRLERAIFKGRLDVTLMDMNEVRDIETILTSALGNALEKYVDRLVDREIATSLRNHVGIDLDSYQTPQEFLEDAKKRGLDIDFDALKESGDNEEELECDLIDALMYRYVGKEALETKRISVLNILPTYFFSKLISISTKEKKIKQENDRLTLPEIGGTQEELERWQKRMYDGLLRDMVEGKLDEYVGLERGNFYSMVDLLNQFRNALPKRYFESVETGIVCRIETDQLEELVENGAARKKRRDLDKDVDKLHQRAIRIKAQLKRDYGLTRKGKYLLLAFLNNHRPDKTLPNINDYDNLRNAHIQYILDGREYFEREMEAKFFTFAEVLGIMRGFGMRRAVRLFHRKNFTELAPKPTVRGSIPNYWTLNGYQVVEPGKN